MCLAARCRRSSPVDVSASGHVDSWVVDMGRNRAAPSRYRGRVLGAAFPIGTSRLVLRPYEAGDLAFLVP
jgi:hypothetical protein